MMIQMSILDDIKSRVSEIADLRGLPPDRAFGFWFLEDIEDLSEEEAESIVTDGPWDGGRDAVYFDEENLATNIYQFKYSEDLGYASKGLTDLQNAVQNETANLKRSESLRLYIVTVAAIDDALHEQSKKVLKLVRSWLTKQGYDIDCDLELIDLKKFAQMFEQIFGLDLTVTFRA